MRKFILVFASVSFGILTVVSSASCAHQTRADATPAAGHDDDGRRARAAEVHGRARWRATIPPPPRAQSRDANDERLLVLLRDGVRTHAVLSRYVDTVRITTADRGVLLEGRVDSREDAHFLVEMALGTEGVRRVYDALEVGSDAP